MSSDGQPGSTRPAAPQPLRGRYVPEEPIDERAFFTVWRGRDTQTGRHVWLHYLRPDYSGDRAFVERLQSEVRATESLQHPNVVPIYDIWLESAGLVVAGAAERGIHLKERIRRVAPFPLAVAIDIAIAVAEALDAAARQGRNHGDVRPENILITPDGEVKVMGFGIGPSLTVSSRIQLTALSDLAPYLAPERAQGGEPAVSSDVYALGVVLYEMLAGARPFTGETPLAIAVKHLHEAPPPLRTGNPSIPAAVEGTVQKCLEKDPARRYTSMAGVLEDLYAVREALRLGRPLNWSPAGAAAAAPAVATTPAPTAAVQPAAAAPALLPMAEPSEPSGKLLLGLAVVGALLAVLAFFGISSAFFRTPPDVEVPNVLGKSRAAALAILQNKRLKAEFKEQYHDKIPAGVVYLQNPEANRAVKLGNTIQVFISRGLQPITVPDLVGKPHAEARRLLREAGLNPGQVREQFSEALKKGEVISQEPPPGTPLDRGTLVNLILSKGPEPTEQDPDDVDVQPTEDERGNEPQPTPEADLPERAWDIVVRVPPAPDREQRVRVAVTDEDGTEHDEYDEHEPPGETLQLKVTGRGKRGKVRIRVYIDGRMVHDDRR